MGIPPSRDQAGLVWKHLLNKVEGRFYKRKMHGNISSLGDMQGERAHVNCFGGCMTWAHLIGGYN